jgi:hypothetical protein
MNSELLIKIIFEEYQALRAEIQRRSQAQLTCLQISLLSMGALSGIVTSNVLLYKTLLLIAPWILLSLGSLWCDHHIAIHSIGSYIKTLELSIKTLHPEQISKFLQSENWGWETGYSKKRQGLRDQSSLMIPRLKGRIINRLLFLQNFIPFFFFFIPSLLSIISYLQIDGALATITSKLIFLFDILLLLLFILYWIQAGNETSGLLDSDSSDYSTQQD